MNAGFRPHVQQPVRCLNGFQIVFDDDHRIAEVAQTLQCGDQPGVIALVQPDRRLIENIEHADELAADLCRQTDALRLTAGERARRAVERNVVKPDADEK